MVACEEAASGTHMRDRGRFQLALLAIGAAAFANSAVADDKAIGKDSFEKACVMCHSEPPVPRALSRAQFAKLPPEQIFAAQLSGKMVLQAAALTEIEKRAVAIYLSEIPWGTVPDAKRAEKLTMCEKPAALAADALEKPHWSGWGLDADNTHFQPAASAGAGGTRGTLGNAGVGGSRGTPATAGIAGSRGTPATPGIGAGRT